MPLGRDRESLRLSLCFVRAHDALPSSGPEGQGSRDLTLCRCLRLLLFLSYYIRGADMNESINQSRPSASKARVEILMPQVLELSCRHMCFDARAYWSGGWVMWHAGIQVEIMEETAVDSKTPQPPHTPRGGSVNDVKSPVLYLEGVHGTAATMSS